MSRFALSRRGSASESFGPLTFLRAGYGKNAEQLGKIAAELREIDKEKHGDLADASENHQQEKKGR